MEIFTRRAAFRHDEFSLIRVRLIFPKSDHIVRRFVSPSLFFHFSFSDAKEGAATSSGEKVNIGGLTHLNEVAVLAQQLVQNMLHF